MPDARSQQPEAKEERRDAEPKKKPAIPRLDADEPNDERDQRFVTDWRGRPSEHAASRRARPYRWPFVKEPLYDGDDALYGPYGYESAEADVEETPTHGALRERTWRALDRTVPPWTALAYPEVVPPQWSPGDGEHIRAIGASGAHESSLPRSRDTSEWGPRDTGDPTRGFTTTLQSASRETLW